MVNEADIEVIRDHLLAIKERTRQILMILNEEGIPGPRTSPTYTNKQPIPDGVWKEDPITKKQIAILVQGKVDIWDGITKGEASKMIEDLFNRRKRK